MELIVRFRNRLVTSSMTVSSAQAADAKWFRDEADRVATANGWGRRKHPSNVEDDGRETKRDRWRKPPPTVVTDDDDDSIASIRWKEEARAGRLIVDFPRAASHSSETGSAPRAPPPRVTFSSPDRVFYVEDYVPRHWPVLWYTNEDLELFEQERERDVKQIKILESFGGVRRASMEERTMTERRKTTSVGLENFLGGVDMAEVAARREIHRRAVLEEQWRQTVLEGCETVGGSEEERVSALNPEAIARVSRRKSEWARRRAEVAGVSHAQSRCFGDDVIPLARRRTPGKEPSIPIPPSA